MASDRGGMSGERTRSRIYVVEEFVPIYTDAKMLDGHHLFLSLPGFKKEAVRIQALESGDDVSMSGESRVNDEKYMYFEKNFKVPEDCEVPKTVNELSGHVFHVIFPKRGKEEQKSEGGQEVKRDNNDNEKVGRGVGNSVEVTIKFNSA